MAPVYLLTLATQQLPAVVPQRPLSIPLPRQLGFTWLVLQWCGAGFGFYCHQLKA